jgi:transcriptional regulator GlxA family with amidase domain
MPIRRGTDSSCRQSVGVFRASSNAPATARSLGRDPLGHFELAGNVGPLSLSPDLPGGTIHVAMPKRVAVLAYPGVQSLDVVGPHEVFARTSRWLRRDAAAGREAYTIEIIGIARGSFAASSGLKLHADRGFEEVGAGIDTLIVAGGIGSERFTQHAPLIRWLRRQASMVRRLASVCTGAFLLAEAGLLSGHRATTHWASCAELAERYPDVRVEPDRLYVREGSVCTSAGVTAGIDMSLALVEEDHGREAALAVARVLVMFLRRPGGQSQFSAQLAHQLAEHEPLRELQGYIVDHPRADLSVEALARRVAMSPRNFARVFTRQVGATPARFVNAVRVDVARRMLEESSSGIDAISASCGLGTAEAMRRAFLRVVGVPPGEYRARFNPPPVTKKRTRKVA